MLSHTTAGAAWDVVHERGAIHVTIAAAARREPGRGVVVHRARGPIEATRDGPLPLTTVARTLLDLSATLGREALEAAIGDADLRGRYDGHAVGAVLAAHPLHAGASQLRATLDRLAGVGAPRTRSELEVRMRVFCTAHDLRQPATNAIVDGYEVDCWWPEADVIVEVDGWRYHRMPGQRERDAVKRLALEAAGHRVVVLTWDQITRRPGPTAAALRRVLRGAR